MSNDIADRTEATMKEQGWKPEDYTGHKVWMEKETKFKGNCHAASNAVKVGMTDDNETLREALPEMPARASTRKAGGHKRDALYNLLTWKQKFWLFLGRRKWTCWIREKLFKQSP